MLGADRLADNFISVRGHTAGTFFRKMNSRTCFRTDRTRPTLVKMTTGLCLPTLTSGPSFARFG